MLGPVDNVLVTTLQMPSNFPSATFPMFDTFPQGRLTRGTVTSTMRRAAHPSGCARCGAGSGCSAMKNQSLTRLAPSLWQANFRDQAGQFRMQGSGCRVQGSGFRVQGPEFRVQGSGFRVQGSGFGVQGAGFRVQGSRFRGQGSYGLFSCARDSSSIASD